MKTADILSRFGLSESDSADRTALRAALLRIASELLVRAPDGVDLRMLQKHLDLRRLSDGVDNELAREVVALLKEATRESAGWKVIGFDQNAQWVEALSAIICAKRQSDYPASSTDTRMIAVAQAVKGLRKLGYDLPLENGRIIYENWEPAFLEWLDGEVLNHLGGQTLAELVFRNLDADYCQEQGYYHIVRSAGTNPGHVPEPGLPSGYLLNLAAKHYHAFPREKPDEVRTRRLLEAANFYAMSHDLAPSFATEIIGHDAETIVPLLKELAGYDTFYQFPQFRLSDVSHAIVGLFDWLSADEATKLLGATTSEIAALIARISTVTEGSFGPVAFVPYDFRMDIAVETAQKILDAFSHKTAINAQYTSPLQTTALNAWSHPFVPQGGQYGLLDARLAGNSFLECAASNLRRVHTDTDQRMGLALEVFVRKELRNRGVDSHSGKYKSSVGRGECDIVIETGERLIFIELKKKSLTRRSRSGNDWYLLRDLCHALLEPQRQLGRHELAIRRDDCIRLDDGSTVHRNNRGVERVALTLFDFGAFHSRDICEQLLDLLAGASISSPIGSPEDIAHIDQVCADLGSQFKELALLRQTEERHHNCWFLGLPQLLVLLDHVSDTESFWKELKRTKHIGLGRLSWFSEHHFMRQCPESLAEIVKIVESIGGRLITG